MNTDAITSTSELPQMELAQRYRITFNLVGLHRKDHVAVLDYIYETEQEYFFSGRPVVGTQSLPKKFVKAITLVDKKTPIVVDMVVKG